MVNMNPSRVGFDRHRQKNALKKARRLAKARPKWEDEKNMKIDEYEAYILRYMELDEDDEGNPIRPSLDQAKIAKDIMALKMKTSKGESNPLLDEE